MKSVVLWLEFHWSLPFTSNWQWVSIGSGHGFCTEQVTSHYLNQCYSVPWHIYAALGGDQLTYSQGPIARPNRQPVFGSGPEKDLANYTPASTKLKGGYTGFTLSVNPSVRSSVCPSVDRIESTLYLQQYSSDPFHIAHLIKQLQKVCRV